MHAIVLSAVSSGLYYKHITILNDDYSVVNMWQASLNNDTIVVNYDRNMFTIQATYDDVMGWL
jgi:hypothetical protein